MKRLHSSVLYAARNIHAKLKRKKKGILYTPTILVFGSLEAVMWFDYIITVELNYPDII